MAMEFEGFSMREYTSRMRSLNVVNCWPFDESDEDVVKSLLPPITVKKFTWWFDALELSRSDSIKKVENSKKKKKIVQEKGESSLRNQEYIQEYIEESDFDAEDFIGVAAKLKTFRGKMKPRAPKERSIKELFAVAPPVDRVSTEEDEEDDDFCDSKEIKWGLKGKRNEKKKNLSKLKKPKKKIKKKINNGMDISIANKEACFKLHLQSQGVVKAYNEPFAPYSYKLEKRSNMMHQFPPQSTTENHGVHAFEYQSFPHLLPKELLRTSRAFPEVNQKRIDGDFVGLPLNSHGELIELNSSGKREFQQTIKPSIGAASSIKSAQKSNAIPNCLGNRSECRSWECRTFHREQSNLLKRNDHSFNTVERDLHPEIESFHGCQEDYQKTRNRDLVLPHLVQSKMRLMGKEFVVSGNELWKDNQMIAEHHSGGNAIENFSSYSQDEPSLGNFKEILAACLSETEINHRSESMLQPLSQFALQSTDMDQNNFVASKRNPVPGLHPCLSPGNSSAVHDVRSIVRDPITHGYESKIVSPEFPMPRPAFQGLPHAPRSVIRFPFMHPDLKRHAQSSWSQRSPKYMSPLFFDVAERETLLSYGQSYSNLGSSYGPHPMPGTSCWTDPRVSLKRETFCLHSSITSGSSLQNSIASAPLTQCAVSCYSGILPNSVLQKRHASQLIFQEPFRSRMRRGHSHGKKARRQASAASVDSFKPMKMPKLGIQEASNFSMTKSMNSFYFEGGAGNIGQPFQSDFAKKKETIMACGEYWNDKDENTVLTGKDPFGGKVSVPKTKHILKACQRNRSE